jgi:hypothetical protein
MFILNKSNISSTKSEKEQINLPWKMFSDIVLHVYNIGRTLLM